MLSQSDTVPSPYDMWLKPQTAQINLRDIKLEQNLSYLPYKVSRAKSEIMPESRDITNYIVLGEDLFLVFPRDISGYMNNGK